MRDDSGDSSKRLSSWATPSKTKSDCEPRSKNISLCKLPKIFGPVYRLTRRGVRLC